VQAASSGLGGDVPVGGAVAQITTGTDHTCAVLTTGKVRCWGKSDFGQLGYGSLSSVGDNPGEMPPPDVNVGGQVTRLASGAADRHTCAVLTTGAARCWGFGSDGRLGYENFNSIGDDETPAQAYAALPGGGDINVGGSVTQIAVGNGQSCALLTTGKLRCWGAGDVGRLGYGDTSSVGNSPGDMPPADVPVGGDALQVSAGAGHTCALLASGKIRCWGSGNAGRLGYGNTDNIGDDETPASAGDVPVF
jgi:alpha-tubulin suppressor-like RCC1 family protein